MAVALETILRFIRERTSPAPVPFVPEIAIHQAARLTPLWHATVREIRGWDESPYWAFPWAGGQALARCVLDEPALVRGLRILDFGTGSGLVALAAARAGASAVTAADTDPFCRAAVTLNARLNGLAVDFREGSPIGDPLPEIDVVLAGDMFYESALARNATDWFRALAARGVLVLAGDAGRTYAPAGGLVEIARYDVPTTAEIEDAEVRRARVVEIAA